MLVNNGEMVLNLVTLWTGLFLDCCCVDKGFVFFSRFLY